MARLIKFYWQQPEKNPDVTKHGYCFQAEWSSVCLACSHLAKLWLVGVIFLRRRALCRQPSLVMVRVCVCGPVCCLWSYTPSFIPSVFPHPPTGSIRWLPLPKLGSAGGLPVKSSDRWSSTLNILGPISQYKGLNCCSELVPYKMKKSFELKWECGNVNFDSVLDLLTQCQSSHRALNVVKNEITFQQFASTAPTSTAAVRASLMWSLLFYQSRKWHHNKYSVQFNFI